MYGCMDAMTPRAPKRGISVGVHRLDVLDSVATAAGRERIGSHGVLVRRQRHVHGAIPDGVCHHLPAARVELPHHPVELVGVDRGCAGRRVVGVRREHCGRVRFDHAVQHDLDGAGLEERIVRVAFRDRVEVGDGRRGQLSRGCQRRIHTHAEVAVSPGLRVELEVFRAAAGVLDAGDAVSLRFADRRTQGGCALGPRGCRHVTVDERHRGFLQHARWLTCPRILDDHAPARVRRLPRDTCQSQRARVHPRCVSVVADDLGRSIG